jgi:hypothetical protein
MDIEFKLNPLTDRPCAITIECDEPEGLMWLEYLHSAIEQANNAVGLRIFVGDQSTQFGLKIPQPKEEANG